MEYLIIFYIFNELNNGLSLGVLEDNIIMPVKLKYLYLYTILFL